VTATLVLHAGPHKTGTTALQRVLAANAGRLARLGVLFPAAGRMGDSHAALAEACRTGDAAILRDLAAEAAGWRAVVLSSENFAMLDVAALDRLRTVFADAEPRVAYSLRRLAQLWPAHWAELVKHGQEAGFDGYLERVAASDDTPFAAPVLPARQLDRLTAAFGRDALRLMVHEARSAPGHDTGPAFIDDMLGLGHEAPHFATARANPTPPARETALVRLMNLHVAGRLDYPAKQRLRLALLAALQTRPPDWLADFDAALAAAPRRTLSSAHPLVAREEKAALDGYGDCLIDPPEPFRTPAASEVPLLEPAGLAAPLRAAIHAFLDGLPVA